MIECAYLYKVYCKIAEIYREEKNVVKEIESLENAVKVYTNIMNEEKDKGFYPWMFGMDDAELDVDIEDWKKYERLIKEENAISYLYEDRGNKVESWEIYKKEARRKLNIKKIIRYIKNKAHDIGVDDISRKYFELLQKLESIKFIKE